MRTRMSRVSKFVRELFAGRSESGKTSRASVPLSVETLEARLALSANPASVPAVQGINLLVPGDAFVLAGSVSPTDYTAMTKWSQPAGLGSTVTITYSYSNLLDGRIGLSAGT